VAGDKPSSQGKTEPIIVSALSRYSPLTREHHSSVRVLLALILMLTIASLQTPRAHDLFVPSEPPLSGFGTIDPLNGLVFNQPVAIATSPSDTNRLFVVERPGTIVIITNLSAPTRSIFLDLKNVTESRNLEAGLLGLEFHPGFATNGYFYVFWTTYTSTSGFTNVLHDRLSRFQIAADNPNRADPNSELPIFSQPDLDSTHNAGDLKFGPDGYLYVSLGDSDPPLSQKGEKAQSLDKGFFGGLLRIDVDNRPGNLPPNHHPGATTHYSIPRDNPFIGLTSYFGIPLNSQTLRTEFFAVGLRNPWRFCFKPGTSEIYCADVGNDQWEEINRITPGANLGWPYFEGTNQYPVPSDRFSTTPWPPPGFIHTPPILVYQQGPGTNEGYSVIGGLFYEGELLPGLKGKYVFGDYRSGHIWATTFDGKMQRVTGILKGLAAFGKDPRDQGVLMVNHWDGTIRKLVYVPPQSASPYPQTLSATGVFNDLVTLAPREDFYSYQINTPFWSDYAIKRRWFRLPDNGEKIGFRPLGPWQWPAGTIFVKHFELELTNRLPSSRHRLETRLLVKTEDAVYGVTYRWNKTQDDAVLVPDEGADETFTVHLADSTCVQKWRYPSRNECLHCHTASAGFILGPQTLQLNRAVRTASGLQNQISTLQASGCFQTPPDEPASLQRLVSLDDQTEPLEKRARSFLAANCAGCHNPNEGMWDYGAFSDARYTAPLDKTGLLGRGIVPNSAGSSLLYYKLGFNGPHRMPPIGSTEIDRSATNLLLTWINSFPPAPWLRTDIATLREGSTTVQNGVYEITGAGAGFADGADSFHFLSRPFHGSGDVLGRVLKFLGQPQAEAGLALRVDTDPGSQTAVLTVNPAGKVCFRVRHTRGGPYQTFSLQAPNGPLFLRLARSGSLLTALASPDGTTWQEVGHTEWVSSQQIVAGLVISSLNPLQTATAHIGDVKVRTANLVQPAPNSNYSVPAVIPIQGSVSENEFELFRFYANGQLIHESIDPHLHFSWTNTLPGTYTLELTAVDTNGLEVGSGRVPITVDAIVRAAVFAGMNSSLGGAWPTNYGAVGFNIFSGPEIAVPGLILTHEGSEVIPIPLAKDDSRLLVTPTGGRSTNVLQSPSSFRLLFDSSLPSPRRITLYFLDWDRLGRIQEVIIRDSVNSAIIDQRLVSDFGLGKYFTWSFTGDIEIEVIAKGPGSAVLSGWFIDSLSPPEVTLMEPPQRLNVMVGNPIVFSGSVQKGTADFDRVELTANGILAAQHRSSHFQFEWVPRSTGIYELAVHAYDEELGVSAPRTVQITVSPVRASASLVNIDYTTQGNWKGIYGTRGWDIAVLDRNLPVSTSVSMAGAIDWTWEGATEDVRALQHPTLPIRSATVWQNFLTTITYRLTSRDPNPRLVSLYMVDYNSGSRRQRLLITSLTGNELFNTEVGDFYHGAYYTFRIEGDVLISFIPLTDHPLLSGVFFDPLGIPPGIKIISPATNSTYSTSEAVTITAEALSDHPVATVDFFANGDLIRTLTAPPYELTTTFSSGLHVLTASLTDKMGESAMSAPVTISVVARENPPMVAIVSPFSRADLPDTEPIAIEVYALEQNSGLEVEYFANENLLGSTFGQPHSFSTTLPAGNYQLTAKATDQAGLVGYAAVVEIEVYRAQPPEFYSISTVNGSVILAVTSVAGGPHILEASADLHTWLPVRTNLPSGLTLQFELAAPGTRQFYRIYAKRETATTNLLASPPAPH
jgi:glucose/arabinose dehydrogenase